MKHEWRKHEKEVYIPKAVPTLVNIPSFKYYTLIGHGNPNDEDFGNAIQALYAMSYGIKMLPKKGQVPSGYFDYTVYPLEGLWQLPDSDDQTFKVQFDLNLLDYKIMIRQPDFVTKELAMKNIQEVSLKKPNPYNELIQFEEIEDKQCVQMLHIGTYASEYETFNIMLDYCKKQGLIRSSHDHREIYISDPRKVSPENMKTVLRFQVTKKHN